MEETRRQSIDLAMIKEMEDRHETPEEVTSDENGIASENNEGDSSTNHNLVGYNNDSAEQEVERVAERETKLIRTWKLMVMGIILLAGVSVTVSVNIYLKTMLEKEIDDHFNLFANTIEDVSRIHFKSLFASTRGLSNALTSEALTTNMTWPFVTFYDFEMFARQARLASGIEAFCFLPLINKTDLDSWNTYALEHEDWVAASHQLENYISDTAGGKEDAFEPFTMPPFVYDFADGGIVPTRGEGLISPIWMTSPPNVSPNLLKVNTLNVETAQHPQLMVQKTKDIVISRASPIMTNFVESILTPSRHKAFHNTFPMTPENAEVGRQPHVTIAAPVFDSFNKDTRKHVGDVLGLFTLEVSLVNLLPTGVRGVLVVAENTCEQTFTFRLDGNQAFYMGEGDLSDPDFDNRSRMFTLNSFYDDFSLHETADLESCTYTFHLRSSPEFEEIFSSTLPLVFSLVVAGIFPLMAITFLMYDRLVTQRNQKITTAAVRSTAIVTSLFPSNVRDRLYAGNEDGDLDAKYPARSSTARLKRFVDKGSANDSEDTVLTTKPIADLFPETTVMFGDIAGFTAWSSMREPSQVFLLLETVYRGFDRIAAQRNVFKVETIGDCYVAVAGCPNPVKNHAVVMARFALSCLNTMDSLTKQLEVTLGPDTGDLYMRIGLHSGPVTAGVLRGERARFQLFGDTMNTASRMESTGKAGRIHVSEETAELLIAAGKEHLLEPRKDTIYAKGKGALKTFWVVDKKEMSGSSLPQESAPESMESTPESKSLGSLSSPLDSTLKSVDSKTQRLIDWNMDVLLRLLKQVVARRISLGLGNTKLDTLTETDFCRSHVSALNEVKEIISLPRFDAAAIKKTHDPDAVILDASIQNELREYVTSLASMYRGNPFHNFEHASHVTMSVVKLLSRIVAPTEEAVNKHSEGNVDSSMHDHTYGITSDPLTQFACVLSALIHDTDHPGVPNAQLVKEGSQLAAFYNNKSVAEQNSVDLSWNLLMDDNFKNLRNAIYGTHDEMKRFRQLVVNSVMATDIADKELKALRNTRWEKAFNGQESINEADTINRKATIVIEHLIQASDVAHTMQHWHIYRKWNERFFMECYRGYKAGRGGDTNPADNWYKGEIGFFDFYIIPLAKKLKECGVFGVSSDEYLNYAKKNRLEWISKGQEIVAAMVDKVNSEADRTSFV